jgi:hypothetical protein
VVWTREIDVTRFEQPKDAAAFDRAAALRDGAELAGIDRADTAHRYLPRIARNGRMVWQKAPG